MSYTAKTISEVVTEHLNRTTFLPAIQREFVWSPDAIAKLFDSIMGDYPISSFLFWKIKEENKNQWTAYEFLRDFDEEDPHNRETNLAGINQDIHLVLDGQQRLTSLNIGLKGSYRYFYYRWYKTKLYLNLLDTNNNDNPEESKYQFAFRENALANPRARGPQYWYLVGEILNFDDAEDAKKDIKSKLGGFTEEERDHAYSMIGRLHSRMHTSRALNYYEEKSQDYDKVVEIFIRANTGGVKLEYSDILLSTATAKWNKLNAREEIHSFTDSINSIGNGYSFGKDFVLKGCLYLTDGLPIQYKVKNFNRNNLIRIEDNWENIEATIYETVSLVSRFGYNDKNLVAKIALLPIAYYLKKLNRKNFVNSTDKKEVTNQIYIQKWLTITLLKNSFGSSSDTTLKNLQDTINSQQSYDWFPYKELNDRLGISASFNEAEIVNLVANNYGTKYSYLILSLLYPDRDWKDNYYHEDHIFPKSEFTRSKLHQRGYKEEKIERYLKYFNTISNLQLLTESENLSKNAKPFDEWICTRDDNFKSRHLIPIMSSYNIDNFLDFIEARTDAISAQLRNISFAR
jgi:uncharacterized protein with ParB-like and HNH nuclease domain